MSLPQRIAFVDIETTGGGLHYDRIIEIGIIRIEQLSENDTSYQITKTFKSLVNPDCYLPPEIQLLTGISPSDVESAPSFREIHQDILDILTDCVFVAHNVRFDYSFIKNELKRLHLDFSPKQFCTVKLSRNLFPQYKHHNLDSIIERLGITVESRHRAFDDANVLYIFFQFILKSFDESRVIEAISKITKRPSVPMKIPIEVLDNLPETPGVYIFYGETEIPLYIGKSVSLRSRILSHFSSDHLSTTELKIAQQIERIEIIETTGELGALLKESDLIKKMQPLYNRKLRQQHQLITLRINKATTPYSLLFEKIDQVNIEHIGDIIGTFRSLKYAKNFLISMTKQFDLCEKALGIEKTTGACFGYRLGRCKGICINKEITARYNIRFLEAFSNNRFQNWPFDGPILIKEYNSETEKTEGYLIDKWCYLGKINDSQPDIDTQELAFDLDSYKIISAFIRSPKNNKKISVLKQDQISQFFPQNNF